MGQLNSPDEVKKALRGRLLHRTCCFDAHQTAFSFQANVVEAQRYAVLFLRESCSSNIQGTPSEAIKDVLVFERCTVEVRVNLKPNLPPSNFTDLFFDAWDNSTTGSASQC